MEDSFFIDRAKKSLSKNIPDICGVNCPAVCCEPIIIGNTILREEINNIILFEKNINNYINNFLSENDNLFNFEGIIISDINTNKDNFISEEEIRKIVIEKLKSDKDEKLIEKYINQIKEKYKQKYISVIIAFSCPKYDSFEKKCLIHEQRPKICREYICEQLEPKKASYDLNTLVKKMKINYNERIFIKKNITKNLKLAIDKYLNNKYE